MLEKLKQQAYAAIEGCKTGRILNMCRRGNLKALSNCRLAELRQVCRKDARLYGDTMDKLYRDVLGEMQKKKKVKVAFVLYSSSMWSCAQLYRLLEADGRFDPYVVVAKYTNELNQTTWPTFHMSLDYFQQAGYKCISVDDHTPKSRGWEAMGQPDVVFYLTPYHALLPVGINQGYLPARVITVYIPYSYMLIQAESKYDVPAFQYSWRHFCDSQIYRKLLLDYNPLYEKNTYFVGYPKMDALYGAPGPEADKLWKQPQHKRIIYAPHHSLKDLDYCSSHFATFDKNGQFMLELAKKYQDTTTWVVKPHPNLRKTVVMADVFDSEADYDAYLQQWRDLPNAQVLQEGTYTDLFLSSDAMICDSVSFLAEYQFTGKPLLLLTRPEQSFNQFGQLVQAVLYQCPGEDLEGIEGFLEQVIRGNDPMQQTREGFFRENLDYYRPNGNKLASQKIYEELCSQIWPCGTATEA